MKRLVLTLAVALVTALSASAQRLANIQVEARFITDKMVLELGLTNVQRNNIMRLNLDYLDAINSLNDISDLDTIYVGKLLYLPTTKENLQNSNYTTVMAHVMKSGETAYDVCQSYGYDYYDMEDTLVKYNGGADMKKLQAGQKLLIPLM